MAKSTAKDNRSGFELGRIHSEPEYGNLTKPLFKPDRGCTDEWETLAKEAGMKYTVLTTKHHDGYTLFNAKTPLLTKK